VLLLRRYAMRSSESLLAPGWFGSMGITGGVREAGTTGFPAGGSILRGHTRIGSRAVGRERIAVTPGTTAGGGRVLVEPLPSVAAQLLICVFQSRDQGERTRYRFFFKNAQMW
jgi:hypothetical protein